MNEKTENLVLEQLRHMRAQNDRILEEIGTIKVEMVAIRHFHRGLELTDAVHHQEIAYLKSRLDRIELAEPGSGAP